MFKPNYITQQIIARIEKSNPGPISNYLETIIFEAYTPDISLENISLEDFIAIGGKPQGKDYLTKEGRLQQEVAFTVMLYKAYTSLAKDVADVLPKPYEIQVMLSEGPVYMHTKHTFEDVWCYGSGLPLSRFIPVYTDPLFLEKGRERLKELSGQITDKKTAETVIKELESLERELNRARFHLQLWPFFHEMEGAYTTMLKQIKTEARLPKEFPIAIN